MNESVSKKVLRRRCIRGALGAVVSVIVTATATGDARAEPPRDAAAAEALFAEGRTLLRSGRVAEACKKFEASQKLDPAGGTLLNLGDCYEKDSRLASAWVAFRDAAASFAAADQAARAGHAQERALALEPRLCRLRVDVARGDRDAEALRPTVHRDGVELVPAAWDQAIPVDAGTHEVSVRDGGAVLSRREVTLTPDATGHCKTVTVAVALTTPGVVERAPASASSPHPGSAPTSAPEPTPSPKHSAHAASRGPLRTVLPFVVAGVGVATIGVSVGLGFDARDTWEEAKSKCEPRGCGDDAQAGASDARQKAAIGTALFVAGAALVGGGALWWVLDRRNPSAVTVSPVASTDALGVGAFGRF